MGCCASAGSPVTKTRLGIAGNGFFTRLSDNDQRFRPTAPASGARMWRSGPGGRNELTCTTDDPAHLRVSRDRSPPSRSGHRRRSWPQPEPVAQAEAIGRGRRIGASCDPLVAVLSAVLASALPAARTAVSGKHPTNAALAAATTADLPTPLAAARPGRPRSSTSSRPSARLSSQCGPMASPRLIRRPARADRIGDRVGRHLRRQRLSSPTTMVEGNRRSSP
jgi:hypothetical protein